MVHLLSGGDALVALLVELWSSLSDYDGDVVARELAGYRHFGLFDALCRQHVRGLGDDDHGRGREKDSAAFAAFGIRVRVDDNRVHLESPFLETGLLMRAGRGFGNVAVKATVDHLAGNPLGLGQGFHHVTEEPVGRIRRADDLLEIGIEKRDLTEAVGVHHAQPADGVVSAVGLNDHLAFFRTAIDSRNLVVTIHLFSPPCLANERLNNQIPIIFKITINYYIMFYYFCQYKDFKTTTKLLILAKVKRTTRRQCAFKEGLRPRK